MTPCACQEVSYQSDLASPLVSADIEPHVEVRPLVACSSRTDPSPVGRVDPDRSKRMRLSKFQYRKRSESLHVASCYASFCATESSLPNDNSASDESGTEEPFIASTSEANSVAHSLFVSSSGSAGVGFAHGSCPQCLQVTCGPPVPKDMELPSVQLRAALSTAKNFGTK